MQHLNIKLTMKTTVHSLRKMLADFTTLSLGLSRGVCVCVCVYKCCCIVAKRMDELRKWCHNNKHLSEVAPQHGGKRWRRYGMKKFQLSGPDRAACQLCVSACMSGQ